MNFTQGLLVLISAPLLAITSMSAAKQPDNIYDVSVIEFKNGKSAYVCGPMMSDPLPFHQAAQKPTLADVAQTLLALEPQPEALISGGGTLYSGIPKGARIRPLNKAEQRSLAGHLPSHLRASSGLDPKPSRKK